MSTRKWKVVLALVPTVGCSKGAGLQNLARDAGPPVDSTGQVADVIPTDTGPATSAPDAGLPGTEIDVAPDFQVARPPDARPADVLVPAPDGARPDLGPAPDARGVDSLVELRDADGDALRDALLDARDVQSGLDLREPPPDVLLVADAGRPDYQGDGSPSGGVIIYLPGDYTAVDSTCAAAGKTWLGLIQEALPEARGCVVDSDCEYASFPEDCGVICPMPINKYRVGEFASRFASYSMDNCGTCPTDPPLPDCTPPGPVACLAGRCEFQ